MFCWYLKEELATSKGSWATTPGWLENAPCLLRMSGKAVRNFQTYVKKEMVAKSLASARVSEYVQLWPEVTERQALRSREGLPTGRLHFTKWTHIRGKLNFFHLFWISVHKLVLQHTETIWQLVWNSIKSPNERRLVNGDGGQLDLRPCLHADSLSFQGDVEIIRFPYPSAQFAFSARLVPGAGEWSPSLRKLPVWSQSPLVSCHWPSPFLF